jgi:spore coat protein U-like protein
MKLLDLRCWVRWLLPAAIGSLSKAAGAAIACSVSVTGFSSVYDALVTTPNDNVGSYTISCTRALSDATSVNFSLAANDGLSPNGGFNRADRNGGNRTRYISYDVYRSNSYTTANKWGTAGNAIAGTVNFGSATAATLSGSYYARIPAQQNIRANRTYADTVGVTLSYGTNGTATASFVVSVSTSSAVQIAVPPGNVAFTYPSFSATPRTASSSYVVRGTNGLAYTMALDSGSGTVLGLTYTLSLSANGGTADGALQTYTINGSMAAGQSGVCAAGSCGGTRAHTLTITY